MTLAVASKKNCVTNDDVINSPGQKSGSLMGAAQQGNYYEFHRKSWGVETENLVENSVEETSPAQMSEDLMRAIIIEFMEIGCMKKKFFFFYLKFFFFFQMEKILGNMMPMQAKW